MRQEEPMDLWVYEREAFDAGIKLVCGVDEAGRGPLAGPVCAAAVIPWTTALRKCPSVN